MFFRCIFKSKDELDQEFAICEIVVKIFITLFLRYSHKAFSLWMLYALSVWPMCVARSLRVLKLVEYVVRQRAIVPESHVVEKRRGCFCLLVIDMLLS